MLVDGAARFGGPELVAVHLFGGVHAVVGRLVVGQLTVEVVVLHRGGQPDGHLHVAVLDAGDAGLFGLQFVQLVGGHAGGAQQGDARPALGEQPTLPAHHAGGLAVGVDVELGREGAEEGAEVDVLIQGGDVGDLFGVVPPGAVFSFHQDDVEAHLVGQVFPAAVHEEFVGGAGGGHSQKDGGLVVNAALGDIELGGTGDALADIAVEIVVAVQHLAVVVHGVDGQLVGFGQGLSDQFAHDLISYLVKANSGGQNTG